MHIIRAVSKANNHNFYNSFLNKTSPAKNVKITDVSWMPSEPKTHNSNNNSQSQKSLQNLNKLSHT